MTPYRTIIQIAAVATPGLEDALLYALTDDGKTWQLHSGKWVELTPIPQPED